MKKSLTIVMIVLLVFIAVACTPETHTTHKWDAGKQTLAPTCESAGEWTYTCTVCGITKTDPIAAKGHTKPDVAKWTIVDAEGSVDLEENEVTCCTDGIYAYRCTECGKEGTVVVTPKMAKELGLTVKHVTKVSGKYVPVLKGNEINKGAGVTIDSAVKYYADKTIAATMFTPVSQIAYCASCGDELGALNKVDTTEKAPTYENIVGTFVIKSLEEGKVTNVSYIDVVESKDGLTVKAVTSSCDAGIWTTTAASTVEASMVVRSDTAVSGKSVRSLRFGNNDYLSENSAGNFVYSTNGSSYAAVDEEKGGIEFKPGHNHKFDANKTSGTKDNESYIGKDNYFKKVTFLGENLMDDTCHYLCCDVCGMDYYPVAHDQDASDKKSCSICGYNSSNYATVTVYGYDVESARADAGTVSGKKVVVEEADAANKKLSGNTDIETSVGYAVAAAKAAYEAAAVSETAESLTKSKEATLKIVAEGLSEAVKSTSAAELKTAVRGTATTADATAATTVFGDQGPAMARAVSCDGTTDQLGLKSTYVDLFNQADGSNNVTACYAKILALSKAISAEAKTLITGRETTADGAVAEAESTPTLTESFVVKTGTVLELEAGSYTSVFGLKYSFMKNSGWSANDSDTIVWNGTGYVVVKTGSLKFYGKASD